MTLAELVPQRFVELEPTTTETTLTGALTTS
jgi:hypothetical protein